VAPSISLHTRIYKYEPQLLPGVQIHAHHNVLEIIVFIQCPVHSSYLMTCGMVLWTPNCLKPAHISDHILRKELFHTQLTAHLQECDVVCNINSSQITIKKNMKLSGLITQGLSISSPAKHKFSFQSLFHLDNKCCILKLVFNQGL
jgi:hypothetical protein